MVVVVSRKFYTRNPLVINQLVNLAMENIVNLVNEMLIMDLYVTIIV